MRQVDLKIVISVAQTETELPMPSQELLQKAKEALKRSYAPYSKFLVGAAVRLRDGSIYIGGNQENAAYPMCLCAERVALSQAAALQPHNPVVAIAITAKSSTQTLNTPVTPCGSCRQALAEAETRYGNPIQIIMQGEEGVVYIVPQVSYLLPLGFDASQL